MIAPLTAEEKFSQELEFRKKVELAKHRFKETIEVDISKVTG